VMLVPWEVPFESSTHIDKAILSRIAQANAQRCK